MKQRKDTKQGAPHPEIRRKGDPEPPEDPTSRIKKPEPFNEKDIDNPWWLGEDPWDELVPSQPGFVSDFVYYMRQSEAPTIFAIWAALFMVAAVVRREAHVEWFGGSRLYPSFYLFFVGPPSTKKSYVVDKVSDILEDLESGLMRDTTKQLKQITVIHQGTPELIEHELAALSERIVTLPDGKDYRPGACAVISAPELARFLGKQKYNEGKIGLLLDLYDCPKTRRVGTIARGWKVLRNVHLMMIAATTKRGMSDSVPEASTGDGFLSRTVLVNIDSTRRSRALPQEIEGSPTKWDIIARLGWIAEYTTGPHTITDEAKEWFKCWYEVFKEKLEAMGEDASPVFSRMDLDIVKVALLMKAQRYSLGTVIELEDMLDAARLIEATIKTAPGVVAEVAGDDVRRLISKVQTYIRRRGKVDRGTILRNMGLTAREIQPALDWLLQTGKIDVWQDGTRTGRIERRTDEEYEWVDKEDG